MRTITVSTRAKTVMTLLEQARHGGVILLSPEGREFFLAEIDDFSQEVALTRKNEALMAFLDERGKQGKMLRAEEVRAKLGL